MDRFPFLKTGTILAKSQSSGMELVVIDCVNITCMIGAISKAHVQILRIHVIAEISSGPEDLFTSKSYNRLSIPSIVKEILGIETKGLE